LSIEVDWRLAVGASLPGLPCNDKQNRNEQEKSVYLRLVFRSSCVVGRAREWTRAEQSEWTLAPLVEELFAANAIKDDLLRMMFSCCHPRLPEKAQVALVLHILCGFSVGEIASAFVSTLCAIEKRITRAKKVLATSKRLFDVATAAEFSAPRP
jgi:predicted RNA polymerase sigma factor